MSLWLINGHLGIRLNITLLPNLSDIKPVIGMIGIALLNPAEFMVVGI